MNRSYSFPFTFALSLMLVGCIGSGTLTNSMAERALTRWIPSGSVTVTGIQEVPQENAAKVDVNFTNFKFKAPGLFGQVDRNYSGPGVAIFTHYNDGRWVLMKVSTSQGFDSAWWDNINVEAQ